MTVKAAARPLHKKPEKIKPVAKYPRVFGNRFGQKLTVATSEKPRRLPSTMKFFCSCTWDGQYYLLGCPTLESRNHFIEAAFLKDSPAIKVFDYESLSIQEILPKDAMIRQEVKRGWAQRLIKDGGLRLAHLH